MNESLRKLLLAGLGAVYLTEEKAKGLFDELVKHGELNEQDAREMIAAWRKRAGEQSDKVQKQVDEALQRGLKAMGYVKTTELDTLAARIAELERKLADREAAPAAPASQD
jgi:polyhydroxyalkanoate synthesis regulator phasin